MREHKINELNNFISGYYIDDNIICDSLINFLEENKHLQKEGHIKGGKDFNIKKSIDVQLLESEPRPLFSRYEYHLRNVIEKYFEKYTYASTPVKLPYPPNLQKYFENDGHFNSWHFESSLRDGRFRQYAFMTYLNTIDEGYGGETEFLYQNIKIRPEKGLTLIWPTAWTHTHKGNKTLPNGGNKYIITSWLYDGDFEKSDWYK